MSAGHFCFGTANANTAIQPSIDWVIEHKADFNKRTEIKKEGRWY